MVLILASELAERLDFTQTKVENRSIVDDTLRDLVSDMVFTVPFRDDTLRDDLTIYILLEHQSTVDHLMGYRMLSYMCQIWHGQLQEQKNAKVPISQWRLRPILPIVFYTGEQQWQLPISLSVAMDIPELMTRFVPTHEILLLDVKNEAIHTFTEADHPFALLMIVLKQENADEKSLQEALAAALAYLETLATENPELHKHAILYLHYLVFFTRPEEEQTHLRQLLQTHTHDKEVENIIMTGAEALIQKSKAEGKAEGIEQGIQKGEKRGQIQAKREVLLKFIDLRIGGAPDTVIRKISRIRSRSRLDALLEQVATAQTLDDIQWQ